MGRLQTYLERYMKMSISCLNITLDIYDQNAYKIWSNYFQNNEIDIFRELKTELSEIDKLYLSGNTYLEVITDCAKKYSITNGNYFR